MSHDASASNIKIIYNYLLTNAKICVIIYTMDGDPFPVSSYSFPPSVGHADIQPSQAVLNHIKMLILTPSILSSTRRLLLAGGLLFLTLIPSYILLTIKEIRRNNFMSLVGGICTLFAIAIVMGRKRGHHYHCTR